VSILFDAGKPVKSPRPFGTGILPDDDGSVSAPMVTTEAVRAVFQAKHVWMKRYVARRFSEHWGRADRLQEATQNAVTLAFENVARCAAKGKIATESDLWRFIRHSLYRAVGHTRAGHSIVKKRDPDRKWGDVWERMTAHYAGVSLDGFVSDRTPVLDTVAFRIDFPRFLDTLNSRQRDMALDLASGMGTGEVAQKYGVSSGAVSQFRTRFALLWWQFFEEPEARAS
jgi:DNA-directed RNA polymerase specialized sigma24 family protein